MPSLLRSPYIGRSKMVHLCHIPCKAGHMYADIIYALNFDSMQPVYDSNDYDCSTYRVVHILLIHIVINIRQRWPQSLHQSCYEQTYLLRFTSCPCCHCMHGN